MSSVHPSMDDTRPISEILANYRRIKADRWKQAAKPLPCVVVQTPVAPAAASNPMEEAHALIEETKPQRPMTTAESIMEAVSIVTGVPPIEIRSQRRFRNAVYARHITYFLCRELTTASLPVIGRIIGHRDHSTVLYGIRKVEFALEDGIEPYAETLAQVRAILEAK